MAITNDLNDGYPPEMKSENKIWMIWRKIWKNALQPSTQTLK